MSLATPRSRFRLYLYGVGAVTLTVTLLRSLALCLAFDPQIGYFSAATLGDGFLTGSQYALLVLGALGCCTLPFFIKRDQLPTAAAPLSTADNVTATLCGLSMLAVALCTVIQVLGYRSGKVSTLPAPAVLMLLAALAATAGAFFFLLQVVERPALATPFGYAVIGCAVLLLSVTYFDRYTPMNAPHKVSLHLALLAIMLATLYDIRTRIGRAMPRVHAIVSAVLFLFGTTASVSNLIAYVAGIYDNALYAVCDLLVLTLAAYHATRAIGVLRAMSEEPPATVENGGTEA